MSNNRQDRRAFIVGTGMLAALPGLPGCGGGSTAVAPAPPAPAPIDYGAAGLYVDEASGLLKKAPATAASASMSKFISQARYGMFLHFGMNTFADEELGTGQLPPATYNPPQINAAQWVKTAKDAGMGCVVLVSKHHDGFCNWPASGTDYSVSASGNRSDVVGAVAQACAAQGIRLAIYYSLWDRHWDRLHGCGESTNWVYTAEQNEAYLKYVQQHLSELMAYGSLAMVWFDGAWAKSVEGWGLERIYDFIKKRQPDCQVGVNTTLDYAHHGPFLPSDFRMQDPFLPSFPDEKLLSYQGRQYFLPWQSTFPLNRGWFWHASDTVLKSLDELEYDYYKAVAQGNALLINSPPNAQGDMPALNVQRLAALRQRLGLALGGTASPPVNLSASATATTASNVRNGSAVFGAAQAVSENIDARWATDDGVTSCSVEQRFDRAYRVDYLVLREFDNPDASQRFGIRSFSLEALRSGAWDTVANGSVIGRSLRMDLGVEVSGLRLNVLSADSPPSLNAFWAFAR